MPDAETLARDDPFQFQCWALGLVGARPAELKKGADKGIDGHKYFHEVQGGKTGEIVFSVKAGATGPDHLRELRGVVEREDAAIGALLCLRHPTKAMRAEAADAGFYTSPWGRHPRVQILTIEELLSGAQLDAPPTRQVDRTFRKPPRAGRCCGSGDPTTGFRGPACGGGGTAADAREAGESWARSPAPPEEGRLVPVRDHRVERFAGVPRADQRRPPARRMPGAPRGPRPRAALRRYARLRGDAAQVPVENPDAYPLVAHRDPDGIPHPLGERNVETVAASAPWRCAPSSPSTLRSSRPTTPSPRSASRTSTTRTARSASPSPTSIAHLGSLSE